MVSIIVKNTFVSVENSDGNVPAASSRSRTEPTNKLERAREELQKVASNLFAPQLVTVEELSASDCALPSELEGSEFESALPTSPNSQEPPVFGRLQSLPPTTCMLRNIPTSMSQDSVVTELRRAGYGTSFNFFYAPLDFKTGLNMGYAFINFNTPEQAVAFMAKFQGTRVVDGNCSKNCDVSWARVQGKSANIDHYRNSPVNDMGEEFRPRLFDEITGVDVEFPRPNRVHSVIRPRRSGGRSPGSTGVNEDYVVTRPRKVFVGGLPLTVDEAGLRAYMSQFGSISECVVIRERETDTSRGFGFCTFEDESAVCLLLSQRKHIVGGHSVSVKRYTSHK